MSRIRIGGSNIFYAGRPAPDRPTVLFCHGAGGSHRHWLNQVQGLAALAAPLAVDLPGHGASEGEPAAEIAVYREFLHRFSTALGLEKFFLAGHSMGGAVALDYALHHGSDLSGLILAGCGARLRVQPPFLEACRQGQIPPQATEVAYGPAASAELRERARQELAAIPPETYLADLTACDNFDCMESLAGIELPVLLICGDQDLMTPLKYSHFLLERLARAELVEVEGAGHMIMLEAPQRVNRAIASYLERASCG